MVNPMRQGWESKKRSAKTVSNPHIDEIYNAAIDVGALAGKVSGVGGGGFMMFLCRSKSVWMLSEHWGILTVKRVITTLPKTARRRGGSNDLRGYYIDGEK